MELNVMSFFLRSFINVNFVMDILLNESKNISITI